MFAAMLPIIGCNWGLFRQMTDWQTFIYCWNQTILFWIHVNLHIISNLSSFFCQSSTNNENQQFHPQHFGKYFQLLLSVTFKSRLILSIPQKMLHHLNFHFFRPSSPFVTVIHGNKKTKIVKVPVISSRRYDVETHNTLLFVPFIFFPRIFWGKLFCINNNLINNFVNCLHMLWPVCSCYISDCMLKEKEEEETAKV